MKRKSRYEPLETDIAKNLTPSGNHEKATTTTVTYDMVFDNGYMMVTRSQSKSVGDKC